jgi:hypothetical protein
LSTHVAFAGRIEIQFNPAKAPELEDFSPQNGIHSACDRLRLVAQLFALILPAIFSPLERSVRGIPTIRINSLRSPD